MVKGNFCCCRLLHLRSCAGFSVFKCQDSFEFSLCPWELFKDYSKQHYFFHKIFRGKYWSHFGCSELIVWDWMAYDDPHSQICQTRGIQRSDGEGSGFGILTSPRQGVIFGGTIIGRSSSWSIALPDGGGSQSPLFSPALCEERKRSHLKSQSKDCFSKTSEIMAKLHSLKPC